MEIFNEFDLLFLYIFTPHAQREQGKVIGLDVLIGERAKRARHSQVCSIENRGYILYIILYIVRANFILITRKEGGA